MTTRGLTFKLTGDTQEADDRLENVTLKLGRLTDLDHKLKLGVDDERASIRLREVGFQLDKIGRQVARPHISTLGIERADLALDKLSLKLDAIDAKSVSVSIGTRLSSLGKRGKSLLKSPFSANAIKQLFTGKEGEAGGLASFAGSPMGIGAIATAISALPALAGGALSLAAGGGGLYAAFKTDHKAANSIKSTFSDVMTSVGKAFSPVANEIAKFVKHEAGPLRRLFLAAEPGMMAFTKALEPAIKQALPALTGLIKEITPEMGLLGKSFGELLTGSIHALQGMSKAFGDSARVVFMITRFIGNALGLLGTEIGGLVRLLDHLIHGKWKLAWGDAKVIFHGMANFVHLEFGGLVHDIIHAADRLRHDLASSWDDLWTDLRRSTTSGVHNVLHWFEGLPKGLLGAVKALPGQMFNIGKQIALGLLHGLESFGPSILSWASNLGGGIAGKVMHALGVHSPSQVMHEIGLNVGRGLALGMEASTSLVGASAGRLAGTVTDGVYVPSGARSGAQAARLQVVVSPGQGMNADLTAALLRWLRFEVRTTGAGNAQKLLGRS